MLKRLKPNGVMICYLIGLLACAFAVGGCLGPTDVGDDVEAKQSDSRGTQGYTTGLQVNHFDLSGVPRSYDVDWTPGADPKVTTRELDVKVVRNPDNTVLLDSEGNPVYEISSAGDEGDGKGGMPPGLTVIFLGNNTQHVTGDAAANSRDSAIGSGQSMDKPISNTIPVNANSPNSNLNTQPAQPPAANDPPAPAAPASAPVEPAPTPEE